MTDLLLLIVSAALINNFVLVQFLGLCPFLGVSSRIDSALGMSIATTFVLTLSSVVAYLLQSLLLIPLDAMCPAKTLAFIVAIAVAVQFTELAKEGVTTTTQRAWYLSSTDHDQLRCLWSRSLKHQPGPHACGIRILWDWCCFRVLVGFDIVRSLVLCSRALTTGRYSRTIPRCLNCADYCWFYGSRVHGL